MGMASTIALKPPVRVVIQTPLQIFDTYSGDQLIEKVVEATTNSIRPLVTRVDHHAYIVFDYGVRENDNEPQVIRLVGDYAVTISGEVSTYTRVKLMY